MSLQLGRLDSRVVFTLDFRTLVRYALGREFEPWWRQTLFRTQAQHLCFIHNSVWFVWFDTIICLSNLSCELWSRKLKIKEIYLKKKINLPSLFSFYAEPSGGKLKDAQVHFYTCRTRVYEWEQSMCYPIRQISSLGSEWPPDVD